MTIKSKPINRGNPCEAQWLSDEPSGERGTFYFDESTGKLTPGYPPEKFPKYGTAPMVMFDEMPTTYHEAAGRDVSSRKEWERLDKETGAITFGSLEEPKKHIQKNIKEEDKALKADRRKASLNAYQAYKENPQEVRQKVEKQTEQQLKTLEKSGIDINAIKHGVIADGK